MKHFIVVDGGDLGLNNPIYRKIHGSTYNETELRKWATKSFDTNKKASLKEIAKAISRGGWLMFEHIPAK